MMLFLNDACVRFSFFSFDSVCLFFSFFDRMIILLPERPKKEKAFRNKLPEAHLSNDDTDDGD